LRLTMKRKNGLRKGAARIERPLFVCDIVEMPGIEPGSETNDREHLQA
jgi:hypothetical protein